MSDCQTKQGQTHQTPALAPHHLRLYCLFIVQTNTMTSNARWKNNFKDFFFEKGAESAEKLRENVEETSSNGLPSSDPGKEDVDDQPICETVNDTCEENECLTDESKSLLDNNPPGTLKGRLFRMFSKPADRDDEGEQTCANDDDENVVTNGQTNPVQMVDKAVSTEDKDDIPEEENKEGDGNTETSDGPAETDEALNESKVEEKKRFRFQLFSK